MNFFLLTFTLRISSFNCFRICIGYSWLVEEMVIFTFALYRLLEVILIFRKIKILQKDTLSHEIQQILGGREPVGE